jgi:hypothetical protein
MFRKQEVISFPKRSLLSAPSKKLVKDKYRRQREDCVAMGRDWYVYCNRTDQYRNRRTHVRLLDGCSTFVRAARDAMRFVELHLSHRGKAGRRGFKPPRRVAQVWGIHFWLIDQWFPKWSRLCAKGDSHHDQSTITQKWRRWGRRDGFGIFAP